MRRLILISTVAFALQLMLGVAALAAPPVVNPKLAKVQEAVSKDMSDDSLNLEHAATVSAELLKADPDNAFSHYAAARLAAWQEKWDEVAAHIEAGNRAPYAVQYQRVPGPGEMFPLNVTVRQLARAVSDSGLKMGPEKAVPLLNSFRTLTRKVAWGEPRSAITVLLAVSTRSIVRAGLLKLTTPGTPEAAAAQKELDADRAFARKVADDGKKLFGEGFGKLEEIAAKHKVTVEQIRTYAAGGKIPAAARAAMPAINKEIRAIERPWVARWLKELPE